MFPQFQIVPVSRGMFCCARIVVLCFLAGSILICPLAARAQDAPSGVIGRVEGQDISCESTTPANGPASTVGASLAVSNGTVITVHSGQALLTLFAGGKVDVCGPAKFTVLLSNDSITLALDFGRVRVELPGTTALRIFTPTIIGTPLDIAGGSRDVTVGLNLDDSLCVVATSGAIQLEHQFTGEKLIVPQAGEFFLNAGRLLPVAGTPGSCQCVRAGPIPARPPQAPSPDYATAIVPRPDPPPAPVEAAPAVEPETNPNIQYSRLAQANETHPIVLPAKQNAPAPPPSSNPVYTAVLPPLSFMAGSPTRPPDPAQDMVLLIREAQVSPEWEFSGHVNAPEFAQAMQHALGEAGPSSQAQPGSDHSPMAKPTKRKGGFWASLRRAFGGGSEQD
jgi:hypothetical protein